MLLFARLLASPAVLAAESDVNCHKGWCLVREPVLRELLAGTRRLVAHAEELRELCGWKDKP